MGIGIVVGSSSHILIVEDDEAICALLRYNLEREGYSVGAAHDGEAAIDSVTERKPDLVLLDWMLPKLSGIEVCRQLRRSPRLRDIPIIIVSAKGDEADKVRGLQMGADDYVTKPFSVAELLARIQRLLRRAQSGAAKGIIDGGAVAIDLDGHKVVRNGRSLHLGPTEFRMLRTMISHPGRVFWP